MLQNHAMPPTLGAELGNSAPVSDALRFFRLYRTQGHRSNEFSRVTSDTTKGVTVVYHTIYRTMISVSEQISLQKGPTCPPYRRLKFTIQLEGSHYIAAREMYLGVHSDRRHGKPTALSSSVWLAYTKETTSNKVTEPRLNESRNVC